MKDLNEIIIFTRVAQLKSFSKAAASLQIPVSTVSRKVSQLEARLGVTLLQRTTRQMSLTDLGQQYFTECAEVLQGLEDAESHLTQLSEQPEGLLRISAPVGMSSGEFMGLVSGFLNQYPRVSIELVITNQFVDLISENIDLAIRFGDLTDTSLIAQRLGTSYLSLVAAPEYLKKHGRPKQPSDLKDHECIVYRTSNPFSEWQLRKDRKIHRVKVSGRAVASDMTAIKSLAISGHGIAQLPGMFTADSIRDGSLCRVLTDWTSPSSPVNALYPSRKFNPARLTAFLNVLKSWKSPYWE